MSLDRKKSDCGKYTSGSECLLKKRRSKCEENSWNEMHSNEEINALRNELEKETKRRNESQCRYADLNKHVDSFMCTVEDAKNHPESEYDSLIAKQNCVNDTISVQLNDAKNRLANLTHSLKSIQVCGKECMLTSKDLVLKYDCMSKQELTKEIKRFERMQIDLKSNLDRLQWRLDGESKEYFALVDQYQKYQIELYYLQNLNDKYAMRGLF